MICPSRNEVCVGGSNYGATAVYGSFLNPGPGTDREEPDVTGLAVSVDLADFQQLVNVPSTYNVFSFQQDTGTSFSAPIITALAANLSTICEASLPANARLSPAQLSALLRTGAWRRNPNGQPYSTPGAGFDDRKDGAGAPSAEAVALFCNPTLSGTAGAGLAPIFETASLDPTVAPLVPSWVQAEQDIDHPSQLVGAPLAHVTLKSGDRIRVTASWEACTVTDELGGLALVPEWSATDFNLFLCNDAAKKCEVSSQSFFDNNEGFDFTVSGVAKPTEFTVYWAAPQGATACDGGPPEKVAYAIVSGASEAFDEPYEACTYP